MDRLVLMSHKSVKSLVVQENYLRQKLVAFNLYHTYIYKSLKLKECLQKNLTWSLFTRPVLVGFLV